MFLTLQNKSVQAEVIGERINRIGSYRLENQVSYHVHGREKGVNWLKNRLEVVDKILEKRHKTHRNILMSSSILLDCPLLSGS